ncbi:DNRLRE domain-containing protein [candidate division KSB1 bacterium]|nr:DNRLRE domain-containing protein [candidate division KSB1 bacterium]
MKKTAVPLFGFLLFGMLFSLACSKDTPISGNTDLIDRDDLGNVLQSSIKARMDSSAGKTLNTAGSSFLFLGSLKDVESRVLLRFDPLPDSGTVVAARLHLPAEEATGQSGSFDAAVHQVTTPWNASEVIWGENDFPVQFNPAMDMQQIVATVADTTDTIAFNLDPQVVAGWFSSLSDDTRDTNGVLLQAPTATFIKTFPSRFNSSRQPFLELTTRTRINNRDSTITTRRSATASGFVFKRLAPLPAQRLYVGNGESLQSVLSFDLRKFIPDTIPKSATISRATLSLQFDAANSVFVDSEDIFSLTLYVDLRKFGLDTLKSADLFQAPLDSLLSFQSISVGASSTSVQLNITSLVQRWVLLPPEERTPPQSYGYFYLVPDFPALLLSRAAFYSRENSESLAPKLKIEYTTPPKAR